jgi:hypothetical protein
VARFSGSSSGGEGTVGPAGPTGPEGPAGADGADGADALWNFLGEWQNGVDYAPGSVVQFEGSSYYHPDGQFSSYAPPGYGWLLVSAKGDDGSDGADGNDGATGSPGLVYLGNYVSGNGYISNLAVVKGSDDNLYIATSSGGLGDPVGNTAEWSIFLPKGADGADGEDGATGPAAEETSFTVNGGTLGTQPTFDGAPLFSGSYVKNGPLVHFQIQVDMDNITGFGTGQYYVDLPFVPKYGYQFKNGCYHDISTEKQYAIGGHVYAGNSQMLLSYTDSNGQDADFDHNSPVTLNVADNFHIAGSYITN